MAKSADALERLRSSIPKLNLLADQASEVVKILENILTQDLKVGVEACVQIDTSEGSDDFGTYLEYRRHSGRFRICIVLSTIAGEDVTVKSWHECSRAEKLETFSQLPKLVEAIADQADYAAQCIEKSIIEVAELSQALKFGQAKGSSSPIN